MLFLLNHAQIEQIALPDGIHNLRLLIYISYSLNSLMFIRKRISFTISVDSMFISKRLKWIHLKRNIKKEFQLKYDLVLNNWVQERRLPEMPYYLFMLPVSQGHPGQQLASIVHRVSTQPFHHVGKHVPRFIMAATSDAISVAKFWVAIIVYMPSIR